MGCCAGYRTFLAGCVTCAMLRMCLISAKFGGTYFRLDSAKNWSNSLKASTSFRGVKNDPTLGTIRLSLLCCGCCLCSLIHRSIFCMTSSLVWVWCIASRNSIILSCSFRWPLRRSTAASDALLALCPNISGSGELSNSCQYCESDAS